MAVHLASLTIKKYKTTALAKKFVAFANASGGSLFLYFSTCVGIGGKSLRLMEAGKIEN